MRGLQGKGQKGGAKREKCRKKYKRGRLCVKCSSHSACLHSVLSPYTSSLNLNQLSTSSLCVRCKGSVPAADETCGYGSEAGASYRCGDPSLWCRRLERVGVHSWSSLDLGRGGPTDFKPGDTIVSDNWCQLLESDEGYGTTGCVFCQLPGSVGSQCQLLEPLWVFNYPSWGRSSVCSQPAYGGTGRTKVSAGLSISGWSRAMGHSLAAGRIYLMLGENRGKQWRFL